MPVLLIVCTSSSWTKYKADWPLHLLLIVRPSQTRCSPSKLNWALVCPSRDAHENLNNNKQKYKGVWSAYSQKWFFKFHTSSFIIQSHKSHSALVHWWIQLVLKKHPLPYYVMTYFLHSLYLPFIWQDRGELVFKQVSHLIICHVSKKCHATLVPLSSP